MEGNDDNFVQKDRTTAKRSRRSSFFKRRLSSYTGSDYSSPSNSPAIEEKDSSVKEEERLLKLIEIFKQEKEDWKNLYLKLKKEHSESKEKCSEVLDHASSWKLLTNEDKKFLQDRPDYLIIGRLLESTIQAVAIKDRRLALTTDRVHKLIQDCEEMNKDMTAKIIDKIMNGFQELNLQSEQFIRENISCNDNK